MPKVSRGDPISSASDLGDLSHPFVYCEGTGRVSCDWSWPPLTALLRLVNVAPAYARQVFVYYQWTNAFGVRRQEIPKTDLEHVYSKCKLVVRGAKRVTVITDTSTERWTTKVNCRSRFAVHLLTNKFSFSNFISTGHSIRQNLAGGPSVGWV